MRKTITNSLVLAVSLLCLFVLGACPPEASPAEDTEEVKVTGIPPQVGNNNKTPFKVYVQLSSGTNASAGYAAKGEAKLSPGATEVTITELKDKDGKDWTNSNFSNVCVLISPETVTNIDDIDAKAMASASSKILVLDWKSMAGEAMINSASNDPYSLAKLYNGIVVGDTTGDIKGTKTPAPVSN